MDAPGGNRAPVVIKRKKKVIEAGHHGGAWKVAYADFVTAMMAFFMLMWLLNATTEKQRKGLADYFSPSIAVNRISGGGDGDFGGDSVFTEERMARNGTGASNLHPTSANAARGETGMIEADTDQSGPDDKDKETETLKEVEEILLGRTGESTVSDALQKHVRTRVTDEGLIIELFDMETARLFKPDDSSPTILLEELARIIASVSDLVDNDVAIEGHTHARPIVTANSPVWGLSTKRADKMRALLQDHGIEYNRMKRITGHADRQPVTRNAFAIRNNRLEVILLRSDLRGR